MPDCRSRRPVRSRWPDWGGGRAGAACWPSAATAWPPPSPRRSCRAAGGSGTDRCSPRSAPMADSSRVVDDEADRLYGLPLEQFTAERDAAAKALRKGGDGEAAAVRAKLPKPTAAAWAANQIARTEPDVRDEFLAAGAALREAQEAALAGDAGGLREATRAQRAAVDAFMAAAQPLQPGGRPLSRAMSDRLRMTLLAAAGNEELSEALADGRLALEAEAGGAGPPPAASDVAAAPRRREPRPAAKST